jgi:hypothetical protein
LSLKETLLSLDQRHIVAKHFRQHVGGCVAKETVIPDLHRQSGLRIQPIGGRVDESKLPFAFAQGKNLEGPAQVVTNRPIITELCLKSRIAFGYDLLDLQQAQQVQLALRCGANEKAVALADSLHLPANARHVTIPALGCQSFAPTPEYKYVSRHIDRPNRRIKP